MKRIEAVLSREIGLSARSIGTSAVEGAIKSRMAACGISELGDYATRLQKDNLERRALVEEIVVSETWFFRDEDMFRTLTRHVSGPWRLHHPTDKLRVLSIPCATGEEPYSVAIALLQSGLPNGRFEVHALDVSARAIEVAERGVYGKNSFRGLNSPERKGYFEETPDGLRVVTAARTTVQFAQGNILEHKSRFLRQQFDVVLCRNLLIYLEREARERALDSLHHWLAEDGVLFSGHAEALENMDARFQRLEGCVHFAYVKRVSAPGRTSAQRGPKGATSGSAPVRVSGAPTQRAASYTGSQAAKTDTGRQRVPAPEPPVVSSRPSLEEAMRLADRGDLAAATALCERHLSEVGASADAYYLLGVLKQAAHDDALARECFDKAAYLNPAHYESLLRLALLHEKRGEPAQAANYRRRAERAATQGGADK
ncbi:MAG TPA: CheR family methyltransferase [Polyangiaceae bacterium]